MSVIRSLRRRSTFLPKPSRFAPLDWQFIVTRGLVIGLSVGIAFVVAIPFLIVAAAR
jgi:hypothetical protein